jgi:hypothetical protein
MKLCFRFLLILLAHCWILSAACASDTTDGYLTAVLRSDCTSAPTSPPSVGETVVGPDYVIKTVARGNPRDYAAAQQVVTDAVFQELMPLYCGLVGEATRGCVQNRVQWNLVTYDASGNWQISGSPTSGAGYHYCSVTDGYIVAIVAGESASLPPLPPVGQVAIGTDAVVMTIADSDPNDLAAAQRLATDAVFESLMRHYCALPRGTGPGEANGAARWTVATYDSAGNLKLSGCAASGCDPHQCVVSRGFITAVLRSECTDGPQPPPPVGAVRVGPDYVIMTVADADPRDYATAQQFATDAVFETLIPLYCALVGNATQGCVTNRVQWNLMTYDAGGNWQISGSPTSGPDFHYFGSCSLTPQQRIQNLAVWVNVDVTAGILSTRDGEGLIRLLSAARRQVDRGQISRAIAGINAFIGDVTTLSQNQQLPEPAAQTLTQAAEVLLRELAARTRAQKNPTSKRKFRL